MPTKPVQLPSGNWRCVALMGRDANGKQIRKSFTDPSKRAAWRLACEHEALYQDKIITEDSQLTVGDAIDKLIQLKEPVLSPSTVMSYKAIRRTGLQGIISLRLCDLTSAIVQQEISREAMTKSPKTVRNAYGLLSAVLKQFHPALRLQVTLPQKKKEEICIPSLNDINALIAAADERGDDDLALAIMFGSQLGLRRSEICALTFADVKDGSVIISKAVVRGADMVYRTKQPKSAAGYRTLPLTTQLAARLSRRSGAPSDFVVPLRPDLITRHFEKLQQALNMTPFRFHDLRHYNASVMISLGVPTLYITRRLGHSSDDMVKRVYGHLIHDKQDDVNRQMSEFFK